MDALPTGSFVALACALVIASPGFYRVVHFIGTGYGFSIAGIALAAAWLHRGSLEPFGLAQLALLVAYGLRLGVFLIRRERRASYQKEREVIERSTEGVTFPVAVSIWLSVAVLYVLMSYPALVVLDALADGQPAHASAIVGVVVMAAGLGLEAWADRQKSRYKAANPERFCDVGLYRFVRCPNYLGESVFWVGQFVTGLAYYTHWSHWLASGLGFVSIQAIMIHSAWRLEQTQSERYGEREDYREYVSRVPILWPLPIYSLKR
ncbi:DUF1295 domain-containing protein [Plesiocystis pacifica]|nr:DUF1295 domain-containing protein [Plesiocystis pacifica]